MPQFASTGSGDGVSLWMKTFSLLSYPAQNLTVAQHESLVIRVKWEENIMISSIRNAPCGKVNHISRLAPCINAL